MVLTNNPTIDSVIQTAEALRQAAMVPGVSQATANAAAVAFYRSVLAIKAANGFDVGCEIYAIQDQLNQSV